MFITTVEELVDALRPRLRDYLVLQLGESVDRAKFKCFVHDDHTPSMWYNPKNGEETVHCFSCGATLNIFGACSELEGLPANGSGWLHETLPHLAEKLGVQARLGEMSPQERERVRLHKLATDIALALSQHPNDDYLEERGWDGSRLITGTISYEMLMAKLQDMSWNLEEVISSRMVRIPTTRGDLDFFGLNKLTMAIRDHRGRVTGFISRHLDGSEPRYINTPETPIFSKSRSLLGIDVAIKEARRRGVYIVEGPGDLAALHRVGIVNAVAICGTAFTSDHLSLLKMLGITRVSFALDWDEPGQRAIQRILRDGLKSTPGMSCYVISAPETGEGDVSELLEKHSTAAPFTNLAEVSAFEWVLGLLSKERDEEQLCTEMIPVIAAESSAVKREMLSGILSRRTGVSPTSIQSDIQRILDGRHKEYTERIQGAIERFNSEAHRDPDNAPALLAELERDFENLSRECKKDTIGVNHQLARYDALQDKKAAVADGQIPTEFKLTCYTEFGHAMAGGMPWTEGAQMYFGGRANSGKTAVVTAIGLDVAITDEDAIVVFHYTDDSYVQVEPRHKTNIAKLLRAPGDPPLTIGMAASPHRNIQTEAQWDVYHRATAKLRELLAEEKIFLLDGEDGMTLSVLERQLRYIRTRYPDKKLLVVSDNTHNYMDHPQLDQVARMKRIADGQKALTARYRCALMATVEYRKNSPDNLARMKLPIDDDIADSRALTYRPSLICHVYNDLHDRQDHAEVFWSSPRYPGKRLPRLMLIITKNKITSFKDKLILDIDPDTVSLSQEDTDRARAESEEFVDRRDGGEIDVFDGVIVNADLPDDPGPKSWAASHPTHRH